MASATTATPDGAQTIATLRDQQEVDGVFACTRKERQISRTGTPYLTVELSDSTGSIVGARFAKPTSWRAASSAASWCA